MALPVFDDERNLEVFQLCCDIIGRTTKKLTALNNELQNLMSSDERGRLSQEARQLISDIQPCFKKANALRDSMGSKIPEQMQNEYVVRADVYKETSMTFTLSQR